MRARRPARAVLGLGILLGLGYLVYSVAMAPEKIATDFEVYRAAAADLWAGEPVYGRSPVGVRGLTYRYPPLLLVWFSLYLLVPPLVGYLIHVAGTLVVSAALGATVIRATERHGVALATFDRVLIVGFVAVSPVGAPSLLFGNVNHHVALAMALGLAWLADGAESRAGVSLALTAGAVFFGPSRTVRYVTAELLPRSSPAAFVGGLPPSSAFVSLRRPLSVAFPNAASTTLAFAAVGLVAPVVAFAYRRSRGRIDRMVAVFVTVAAVLLVLPSYTMYFLVLTYPLVPMLYLLGRPRADVLALGTFLTTLTLKLPDVSRVLALLALPGPVERVILDLARSVYAVGTPVLWGTVLALAVCVWRLRDRPVRERDSVRNARVDE